MLHKIKDYGRNEELIFLSNIKRKFQRNSNDYFCGTLIF